MKKDRERYFRSSNLNLAVFLYAKDQQIAGVNPTNNETVRSFAFISSPMLEELVDLYKWGARNDERLLIEVHRYEQSRRDLLDRLKKD